MIVQRSCRLLRLQTRFFACCLVGFVACKSSTAPEAPPGPPALPDLALIAATQPANAPTQVDDYFTNSFGYLRSTFGDFDRAKGSPATGKHPEWSWLTSIGTWDIILRAKALSENQFEWQSTVDFNEDGQVNWNRWAGNISADGYSGAVAFRTRDNRNVIIDLTWVRDEQDILSFLSETHELPSTENELVITEITARPDGTVEMVVKMADSRVKIFEANWDASGAGSWAAFDASTGQQTGGGTWSS